MRLSIKHLATTVLAVGIAAFALAACGSGGGGGNGTATAADSGGSGIVSVKSVDGSNVLVDSKGQTLYSANVEMGGRIHCTGTCTSSWAPVGASASESKTASADLGLNLGVVMRPDGARQLSFDGRPLYHFTQEGPGQLKGDGFVDDFGGTHFTWQAAMTGGGSGSGGSQPANSGSRY
jgi:predicted lipoprotein with Yx(FWY)xxD motif